MWIFFFHSSTLVYAVNCHVNLWHYRPVFFFFFLNEPLHKWFVLVRISSHILFDCTSCFLSSLSQDPAKGGNEIPAIYVLYVWERMMERKRERDIRWKIIRGRETIRSKTKIEVNLDCLLRNSKVFYMAALLFATSTSVNLWRERKKLFNRPLTQSKLPPGLSIQTWRSNTETKAVIREDRHLFMITWSWTLHQRQTEILISVNLLSEQKLLRARCNYEHFLIISVWGVQML